MPRYRIFLPLTAARKRAALYQPTILTIPPGTICVVTGAPDHAGLVEAESNGEVLAIFQSDLDKCAERISSAQG
jgi:hypothetical protein